MMRTAKAVFSLFTIADDDWPYGRGAARAGLANKAGANTASARTPQLDHDRGLSVSAAEFRRGGNAGDKH